MESKRCIKCKEIKLLDEYSNDKSRIDNLNTKCKKCCKSYRNFRKDKNSKYWASYYKVNKECHNNRVKKWFENNPDHNERYYLDNKETFKEYNRNRYLNDPEGIKEKNLIWNLNNPEKVRLNKLNYENNRVKNDPLYKLTKGMRYAVWRSFKDGRYFKSKRTEEILGCTFEEFYNYIESKFEVWMTWENKGYPKDGIFEPNKTWDIDHIIPVSSAKSEEEVLKLNHYTNFQPLCSYVNRKLKRNRLDFH